MEWKEGDKEEKKEGKKEVKEGWEYWKIGKKEARKHLLFTVGNVSFIYKLAK